MWSGVPPRHARQRCRSAIHRQYVYKDFNEFPCDPCQYVATAMRTRRVALFEYSVSREKSSVVPSAGPTANYPTVQQPSIRRHDWHFLVSPPLSSREEHRVSVPSAYWREIWPLSSRGVVETLSHTKTEATTQYVSRETPTPLGDRGPHPADSGRVDSPSRTRQSAAGTRSRVGICSPSPPALGPFPGFPDRDEHRPHSRSRATKSWSASRIW